MNIKLLTEHHLEFLSLKRGSKGLSESSLVKMPHCWKSHVVAHMVHVLVLTTLLEITCCGLYGTCSGIYLRKIINAHFDLSSGAKDLDFGLSLHLHPYFMYVISEG